MQTWVHFLLRAEQPPITAGWLPPSFSFVSQIASGSCPRTVTRTYSIKDSCNNLASCTQAFTVGDTTRPAISCPAAVTVECIGSVPAAYTTLSQFTAAGGSTSDNCGLVASSFSQVSAAMCNSYCAITATAPSANAYISYVSLGSASKFCSV